MEKQIKKVIRLQINGGTANPSPPIGPACGAAGINIMSFCRQFNDRTKNNLGKLLPVLINIYDDGSINSPFSKVSWIFLGLNSCKELG